MYMHQHTVGRACVFYGRCECNARVTPKQYTSQAPVREVICIAMLGDAQRTVCLGKWLKHLDENQDRLEAIQHKSHNSMALPVKYERTSQQNSDIMVSEKVALDKSVLVEIVENGNVINIGDCRFTRRKDQNY